MRLLLKIKEFLMLLTLLPIAVGALISTIKKIKKFIKESFSGNNNQKDS